MISEIRGFLSGHYKSSDECGLEVFSTDDGTNIIHIDYDLDLYYHWIINEKGNVVYFNMGSPSSIY